jgi:hypothetical protein
MALNHVRIYLISTKITIKSFWKNKKIKKNIENKNSLNNHQSN